MIIHVDINIIRSTRTSIFYLVSEGQLLHYLACKTPMAFTDEERSK